MKGAIASVEIFAHRNAEPARRLTLVVGAPTSAPAVGGWRCRVALADQHQPQEFTGRDSFDVLNRALAQAHSWLRALEAEGFMLFRDRGGVDPYRFE